MRNNIVNNMRLDLDHERTRPRISVRQGDTKTRSLHFTLMQSGRKCNGSSKQCERSSE